MANFPEQLPHGDIQEIFPDVFFVKGQSKYEANGNKVQITRSMTIVRENRYLTLVNTIRLSEDGLHSLDHLGKVRDVIRIGSNHGRDDAFYSDRYNAPVWALEGTKRDRPEKFQATLVAGNEGPIGDATVVAFDSIQVPEAVLYLRRSGGILISCDSLQNMTGPDEFFDAPSAEIMRNGGFFRTGNIGPAWRARVQPDIGDFEKILELDFKHLLPSHGEPLLNNAHTIVRQTVDAVFSG